MHTGTYTRYQKTGADGEHASLKQIYSTDGEEFDEFSCSPLTAYCQTYGNSLLLSHLDQ